MAELQRLCEEYRRRADLFAELVRKLRRLQEEGVVQLGLSETMLEDLEIGLHRFKRSDCDPHYRIAVAGGFSVGKSQLINAMLGQTLLPNKIEECTFLPTLVRLASDAGGGRQNSVRYLTEGEIQEILTNYQRQTGQGRWPTSSKQAGRMTEQEVRELVKSLSNRREREDLEGLFTALRDDRLRGYIRDQDQGFERPVLESEIESLVTRGSKNLERYVCSSLSISLPEFPLGPDVELVDLPGTDAADQWAKQITHRYVKDVHAVLLVSQSEQIFGEAGDRLLEAIKSWGGDHEERLFVVVNKADRYAMEPAAQVVGAFQQLHRGLERAFGDNMPGVFFVSALAALAQPRVQDTELAGLRAKALEDLPNIKPTGDSRLDLLMEKAKDPSDPGGVDHLIRRLREFLAGRAMPVKEAAMKGNWKRLLEVVDGRLRPELRKARASSVGTPDWLVQHCGGELQKILAEVGDAVELLRREAASLRRDLDGPRGPELDKLLRKCINEACRSGPRDEQELDASQLVRRRWAQLSRVFRDSALGCIVPVGDGSPALLGAFLTRCRATLAAPLSRIAALQVPADAPQPMRLPQEPSVAIAESVSLRIWEVLHDSDGKPYNEPGQDELWGHFEPSFLREIEPYFVQRGRKMLTELRAFLKLYLEWHLDKVLARTRAFVGMMTADGGPLQTRPDAFRGLLSQNDAERQAEQRMLKILEVGAEYERVALPATGGTGDL